ncbi:MAG: class I SAM-dependent methyltransferase [Heliomarina sp.]|uniref:class I SAM-dependent methyltransferase n=1 Tax=Heliomarina sp. TaxID=2917556 RepID=UPI004058AC88
MSLRLSLALSEGGLALPSEGRIAVFHPFAGTDLSMLDQGRVVIVQPNFPDFRFFENAGFDVRTSTEDIVDPVAVSIVFLPKAKVQARSLIALAMQKSTDTVVIDGAKTEGIDSIYKDLRKRTDASAALSKAHGKLFWLGSHPYAVADWLVSGEQRVGEFLTAPGVFSADGIDPASALLAKTLPRKLGRHVVDLGAGWGFLASAMLTDDGIETLDLVEANHDALSCARQNVTDPRARFHWADARDWEPTERIDAVVSNPPFHTGRKVDADLGRDFIRRASRILVSSGHFWMVANRHLAYEAVLKECFAEVTEPAGDNRFKVLHAKRPIRSLR